MRELGSGGMARVDLARDVELGRTVAIKWLRADLEGHETAGQRFRNEARLLARVDHPNLIACYGTVEESSLGFGLVLEHIDGEDLQALLAREGQLAWQRAVALGKQVGGALDALHAKGVLHRDLKPGNVMLRRRDQSAVVMDLGLARGEEIPTLTRTGHILGTIAYMAPEVIRGEPYQEASDLFQLGALLFEALAGCRLTPKGSVDKVFEAITQAQWPRVDHRALGIPDHVWETVLLTLSPDPRRRPPSGAVLGALLEGRSSGAWSPPSLEDSTPGPSGRRAGLGQGVLLGALVAVGVAAGAGLGWLRSRAGAPEDVRWHVVGDTLAASMEEAGSSAVGLEVDGEVVPVETRVAAGRRWLLYPGLSRDRERRARLFWPGGQGPLDRFRSGAAVLAGAPRPWGPGRLRLEVRQPCRLALPGQVEEAPIPAGVRELEAPEGRAALEVHGSVEGVPFRGRWTWADLFGAELERRQRQLEGLDSAQRLREEAEGGSPARFEALRRDWQPLVPWLPRMLGEPALTPQARLGLFRGWQEVALTEVRERALGRPGEALEVPAGAIGERPTREGEGFPGGAEVVELTLTPQGGHKPRDAADGSLVVASEATRRIPIGLYADAAPALVLVWPPVPLEAREARLWLQAVRLPEHSLLRIEAADPRAWSGRVELWHPAPTGGAAFRGWSGLRLPVDLWPPGGTRLHLTVAALLREEASLAKLRAARVEWVSGATEVRPK